MEAAHSVGKVEGCSARHIDGGLRRYDFVEGNMSDTADFFHKNRDFKNVLSGQSYGYYSFLPRKTVSP